VFSRVKVCYYYSEIINGNISSLTGFLFLLSRSGFLYANVKKVNKRG